MLLAFKRQNKFKTLEFRGGGVPSRHLWTNSTKNVGRSISMSLIYSRSHQVYLVRTKWSQYNVIQEFHERFSQHFVTMPKYVPLVSWGLNEYIVGSYPQACRERRLKWTFDSWTMVLWIWLLSRSRLMAEGSSLGCKFESHCAIEGWGGGGSIHCGDLKNVTVSVLRRVLLIAISLAWEHDSYLDRLHIYVPSDMTDIS